MVFVPQFQNTNRSHLQDAFPQIEALFKEFYQKRPVPGLAYGIVVDGGLVHTGSMGVQNVEGQQPVTPDSVFRIASMTKSFTGMAVVSLRDAGKLRLDDPVEQYVPELAGLPYPTRDSAPITVRQLMTMCAGLPQDDPWADRQLAISEAQLSALLKRGISFSNPPGIRFEYSNYGYAILGRIVTSAAGMPYQKYVGERILKPLGMTATTFDINAVPTSRLAMGYRWEDDAWVQETPLEDGGFASIGGLFTTVNDFARYMAFLLDAFPPRDDEDSGPVRRSSLREMQQIWRHVGVSSMRATPDAPALVAAAGYGYGLGISYDSALGYTVAHGGGLPGYGSYYRLLPECGIGIVALTNRTYAAPAPAINDALLLLQKTGGAQPRVLSPNPALLELQEGVTALYENWDDAQAKALATESFFQDMALERRRKQVQKLRADFGKCRAVTPLIPENALRGRWVMRCKRGDIDVFVSMAPTVPPRMQVLEFTGALHLNRALKEGAAQALALINDWDSDAAKALFARSIARKALRGQFRALRVQYGRLRMGDALESDGAARARVRLTGDQGMVDMTLTLDEKGRIAALTFSRPRETAFVP